MGLFDGIKSFLGKLVGNDDEEKKRRQQQAQAQQKAAQVKAPNLAAPNVAFGQQAQTQAPERAPELNLVMPGELKKVAPKPVAPKPLEETPQQRGARMDAEANKLRKVNPILGPLADAATATRRIVAPAISTGAEALQKVNKGIGESSVGKAVDQSGVGGVARFANENLVKPIISGYQKSADRASGKIATPITKEGLADAGVDAVNVASTLIPFRAPGTGAVVDAAINRLGSTGIKKVATRTIEEGSENAVQGGLTSGLEAKKQNKSNVEIATDTVKGTLVGLGLGGLFGGATAGLGRAGSVKDSTVVNLINNAANKADTEIAPGVHSANPSRAADALAQAEARAAKEAEQARAIQAAEEAKNPTKPVVEEPVPVAPEPIRPDVISEQEAIALKQLEQDAKTRKLSPEEQSLRENIRTKAAEIDAHNNPKPIAEAAPRPAEQNTVRVAEDAPVMTPEEISAKQSDVAKRVIAARESGDQASLVALRDELDDLVKETDRTVQAQAKGEPVVRAATPEEAPQVINEPLPQPEPTRVMDAPAEPVADVTPTAPAPEAVVAPDAAGQVVDTAAPVEVATPTAPKTPKPKPEAQDQLPEIKGSNTAKTGEKGQSQGKYAKKQEYDKTSIEASRARGEQGAANTSFKKFIDDIEVKGGMDGTDRDVAVALQKRFKPGSVEHRALGDLTNKANTEAAQTLAVIERVIRKTATSDEMSSRFANKMYKVTDDPAILKDKDLDSVIAANEKYADARDASNAALEEFNTNPTEANMNQAVKAAEEVNLADRAAKFQEFSTAQKYLGKDKNPSAQKFVERLEKDAGVYTMSGVDASLLSSTRVMLNNFLNTGGVGLEETMFGKAGAALARKFTGETIGGGSRAGRKLGKKLGWAETKLDSKLRQAAPGNGLLKAAKNIVTTGNTLGERNIMGAAYSGIYDHYLQSLKKAGFSGDELKRRTLVNTLTDPDDLTLGYMDKALKVNSMSSTVSIAQSPKLESWMTDKVAEFLGGGKAAKATGNLVTRLTVGFPTVVARGAQQGTKRAMLGTFSAAKAILNAVRGGSPEKSAQLWKDAVKEAGSGASMYAAGMALGAKGLLSGDYPSDKSEQDRWKREKISENSIKIGGNWYSLPAILGSFALPFMIGARIGENNANGDAWNEDMLQSTLSTMIDAMPVDSFKQSVDFLMDAKEGRDVSDFAARTGSSAVLATIPLGGLMNQVSKMFDPTANDTTRGDVLAQFMAKVQDKVPGLTNMLPDQVVDGEVIQNPGAIPKLFGASSKVQEAGVNKSSEIKSENQAKATAFADSGAFSDNVRNIMSDEGKTAFDRIKAGKDVTDTEMDKFVSDATKGLTEDSDSRFLEDGDYDSNLAVWKIKREAAAKDPTTRKETLEKYDMQIKRGQVYKDNQTPPKLIKEYKEYGLEEWRDLGDPNSDDYNQELYDQLFSLDKSLTDAAASRGKKGPDEAKYYAKNSKGGKGKGGGGGGGGGSIKGNTIGNTPGLDKITLGNLSPQKVSSKQITPIQKVKAGDLIKKRVIKVSKG